MCVSPIRVVCLGLPSGGRTWEVQFRCIVQELQEYYKEKCTSHSSIVESSRNMMIQLLHAMKSAKRYTFYLHSDLVVMLECVFTCISFLVPTASCIISLIPTHGHRLIFCPTTGRPALPLSYSTLMSLNKVLAKVPSKRYLIKGAQKIHVCIQSEWFIQGLPSCCTPKIVHTIIGVHLHPGIVHTIICVD